MRKDAVVDDTQTGARVDRDARFDMLFERHHVPVVRYCVRRLGAPDGEDAAADVFATAWRRIDDVPVGEERAWLFGVAHRIVWNQYRTRRRRRRLTARLAGLRSTDMPDPGGSEVAAVLTALSSLGRGDREILMMKAWDGLTRAEMAAVLGIDVNAVDQRLFRARRRLEARLIVAGITGFTPAEEAP